MPETNRKLGAGVALVVAALAAFVPALWVGFIADDYILRRTLRAVTDPLWPFAHNDIGQGTGSGHFYRPLWLLWNDALQTLFGSSAAVLHAGNLALYAVLTVEVWLLARRLASPWAAWLAALLFAVYPRHAEAVAWIAGSTELVAGCFAIGALLVVTSRWPRRRRLWGGAALAALAALSKEGAFVLPALAGLTLWVATPGRPDRKAWHLPIAMLVVQLAVLAARTVVIGGAGGYAQTPITVMRVAGSLVSYVLGAFSPPQLEVLRHPVLILIPVAVLAGVAWRVRRLRAGRCRERVRLVVAGSTWFLVALVPALNTPLDLNTGNGARVLLLPSVGAALAVAGLIESARAPRTTFLAGGAAAIMLALCVWSAHDWVVASHISDRELAAAKRLGPRDGELVVLSNPEGYRTAIAFQDALDVAVATTGRPDLAVAVCAPVHVRTLGGTEVRFRRAAGAGFAGETSAAAPFDFPVLGGSAASSPGCHVARAPGGHRGIGTGTRATVVPVPTSPRVAFAYFDGSRLRPLGP